MGSHQDLTTNHPKPVSRTLRAVEDYYTRHRDGRKQFVLDEQPDVLRHLKTVDQKAWKQYEAHLRRRTPLERAEFFAERLKQGRFRSIRALARALGRDHSCIARHLRLLDLPEPIRAFLRAHRTPENIRYFSEGRLAELLKLGTSRAAWRRFQEMVKEAQESAGIWAKDGEVRPKNGAS